MRGILCGAVIAFLVTTPTVHAAFNYVSQDRSIFASAGQGGGQAVGDPKQTGALGPWSETALAVYGNEFGDASGSASQVSDLASEQITMSGALSAAGTAGFAGGASSNLDTTFSLLTDTSYVAAFSATGPVSSNAGFYGPLTGEPLPYTVNGSGVLPAGDYRLIVSLGTSAGGATTSGTYAFELSIAGVPEPSSVCIGLTSAIVAARMRRTHPRRRAPLLARPIGPPCCLS